MSEVVLSTVAGLHVPVILLVDVVGNRGAVAPEHIAATASNVGMMLGLTVMLTVVVVAHWPALGANVYVAEVVLLTVAGLQLPVIPLLDVVGKTGAVAPEQIGSMGSNAGTTFGLTVTFRVAVVAHWPGSGVNV